MAQEKSALARELSGAAPVDDADHALRDQLAAMTADELDRLRERLEGSLRQTREALAALAIARKLPESDDLRNRDGR